MNRIFYLSVAALALTLAGCDKGSEDHSSDNVGAGEVMTSGEADASATGTGMGTDMGTGTGAAKADTAFLTDALKGDNTEVAIGKLAAAQALSQKSKDFGAMLATDHGTHKGKVATLLVGAGGTSTDEMSDEGQANMKKLSALKGAEFDKAFKVVMIDDHKKDIAKYEKQASAADAATASLAKETLPTLKKHLEAAKAL